MPDLTLPTRMLAVERQITDIEAAFNDPKRREFYLTAYVQNPLAVNGPTGAPTVTPAAGSVSEDREWAFTFASTETGRESALSPAGTAILVSEEAGLSGARSTDREIDRIHIYTRLTGGTDLDWRRVTDIANPSAGSWSYTDEFAYATYLPEPPPNQMVALLGAAPGEGFTLKTVKLFADGDYDPDTAAYWQLGVEVYGNIVSVPRYTIRQTTEVVGLHGDRMNPIPFYFDRTSVPTDDLGIALDEDDRVYLRLRGVGAVTALPRIFAVAVLRREVP